MKSDDGKTKIFAKLLKYLYGLDDSPKAFNDGLQDYFNDSPYKQSKSEPCLYIRHISDTEYIIMVIYVDDFLVASTHQYLIDELKAYLSIKYVVNISPYADYLGLHISKQPDGSMTFTRPFMLEKIFKKFLKRIPTSEVTSPITDLYTQHLDPESPRVDKIDYLGLLGSIIQMVDVRPELAFAISFCAQRTETCTKQDMGALNRIIDFLYCTRDMCLTLRPGDQTMGRIFLLFRIFTDAGFASLPNAKSQLALMFDIVPADEHGQTAPPSIDDLPTGMFFTKSFVCPTINLSSTDAESNGMLESVKLGIFIRACLADLHFPQLHPTPIFNDNEPTRSLCTKYSGNYKRMRYMLPKIMFLLEQFKARTYEPIHMDTDDLVADIGTKAVTGTPFLKKQRLLLGVAPKDN
jgi:hypothetical protein